MMWNSLHELCRNGLQGKGIPKTGKGPGPACPWILVTGWVLALAWLALTAGCAWPWSRKVKDTKVSSIAIEGGRTGKMQPMTLFELQSRVMSFADGFALGLQQPIDVLQEKLDDTHWSNLHRWEMSHLTIAFVLASGPNPVVNLLDMIGLATLSRMVVEDYWIPQVYGDSAQVLLDYHRQYEKEIWSIAKDVLTEEQEKQMMDMIVRWRKAHPDQRFGSYVSLSEYAKERWRSPLMTKSASGSILSMLYLDPLAKLDPASRQIAQTRYTAERMIYYLQRMPAVLRLQMETMLHNATGDPAVEHALDQIGSFNDTAQRFVEVLDQFPSKAAEEQRQVLTKLGEEGTQWTELTRELKSALAEGSTMAGSVEQAVQSLDTLVARFDQPEEDQAAGPKGPARTFDILDYAETAGEITRAATNLAATIHSLEQLIQSEAWDLRQKDVSEVVGEIEVKVERILDTSFWRAVLLSAVFLLGLLAVLLVYRALGRPTERPAPKGR